MFGVASCDYLSSLNTICVGRNTICDAIAAGAGTAAEIGATLKAGTNCGSCIPELKRLIGASETAPDEQRKVAAS